MWRLKSAIEKRLLKAISLEYLGGGCPVQGEGKVDEYDIYFRARGDRWSFNIGTGVKVYGIPDGVGELVFSSTGKWGENYDAGWMPWFSAYLICRRCIKIYWLCKYGSQKSADNRSKFWKKYG